jgi:arylformamidase
MIIPISYPVSVKTPLYPNTPTPVIRQLRSIEYGDSSNTSSITLSSHTGTHIDAPSHFCKSHKTVADCLTADTTFFPVFCIDIVKQAGEEICINDLEKEIPLLKNADALLIRTGWHTVRLEDPDCYTKDHPWISPEIPQYLREKCPRLRLFGIDQISVSSVLHRDAGRECHRKFLCEEKTILLLEDLNLSDIRLKDPFRLHIYPVMIDEMDGVPVIAVAEM